MISFYEITRLIDKISGQERIEVELSGKGAWGVDIVV